MKKTIMQPFLPSSIKFNIYAACLSAGFILLCYGALADNVASDAVDRPAAQPSANNSGSLAGAASEKPDTWTFKTEQEWIVDSIGRDIAEILAFARDKKNGGDLSGSLIFQTKTIDPSAPTYSFNVSGKDDKNLSLQMTLTDYVWAPQNYEPLAKEMIRGWQLTPEAAASTVQNNSEMPAEFLSTVANADSTALYKENDRVSAALTAAPLDAGLHEQAALLQAAFALQEEAGSFTDYRPPLARVCAHLALARALEGDQLRLPGKLADIFEQIYCGRTASALKDIDALEKTQIDSTTRSWLRAFKIRATGDYRIYDEKEKTAVEEHQFGVRYSISKMGEAILEYLQEHHPDAPILWLRIVLNTNYSVGAGHAVTSRIVPAEIVSFQKDFDYFKKGTKTSFEEATSELNLVPTRCLTKMSNTDTNLRALRVISWDDVAASHMRHILNAVGGEHHFYSAQYGVPELAQKSQEQTQKYFARVKQLPFAMTFFKFEPEEQKKVFEAAQDYLLHQPEQVTSWNWDNMKDCVKAPPGKFGLLPADSWFSPALPMGTVYFYDDRHLLNNFKNDVATLTTLKNISPYHEYLCGALARKKYGKNPTPEQYTEVFGRLADYNIGTMKLIAEAAVENPEICIPLEERLTTLEPATYLGLGNYCVLFHRPDQAANYFEKAEVEYDEAVSKSIYSNWLITYRLEHGQKAKAAELAKWCGEVYSYGGLQALGNYLERTGDLPGAEESYKNAVERYNKKNALAAFYVRNASKKKEYAEQALIMTKDTFPRGLRRASAGDFKGPPKEGVKIIEVDTPHAASPFKEGMIIVAVNGYAVGNDAQQKMAAVFSLAHELKATVWDGKGYKDLQRPFANEYNLGVKVENFKGQ